MLASGVHWHDDWFAIEEIAPGVTAIGEPRFHQINWNYLMTGSRRALLFDTGPGVRDIAKVARSLTTLPVTVLPSHMHFDHTGGLASFDNIAMADLPVLRACERDGVFHASDDLFRGFREGMVWKPVRVRQWLPIGATIDLGGRALEIIHTPGHSPDSISLLDREGELLLAADFVYLGPLYAQIPGAGLEQYLQTARTLGGRAGRKLPGLWRPWRSGSRWPAPGAAALGGRCPGPRECTHRVEIIGKTARKMAGQRAHGALARGRRISGLARAVEII